MCRYKADDEGGVGYCGFQGRTDAALRGDGQAGQLRSLLQRVRHPGEPLFRVDLEKWNKNSVPRPN